MLLEEGKKPRNEDIIGSCHGDEVQAKCCAIIARGTYLVSKLEHSRENGRGRNLSKLKVVYLKRCDGNS